MRIVRRGRGFAVLQQETISGNDVPVWASTLANTGYAFEMTAATNLTLVGFGFFGSNASGQTLAAGLYLDDGTGKPGQKVASGTVSSTPGFSLQRANFNNRTG